ncbi:ParB N-terminal domain-containing protein [Candidatus Micrarchaeota archaeon]|nr:ParB N-terminal domain-containing protein [Candidatus Micrarchaeota archaeon]
MGLLISPHEEEKLFKKLLAYNKKLYPKAKFKRIEKSLNKKQIGEVYYTYPGEESELTSKEKMAEIRGAIEYGYNTPIILLKKGTKYILLDGHRRLKVAWKKGIKWSALILEVSGVKEKLGIEGMIMGKIKDLF